MNENERRAFVEHILRDQVTDIDELSIFDMAREFNQDGAGITDEDIKAVSELISAATVTITFGTAEPVEAEERDIMTPTQLAWGDLVGSDTPGCTCHHEGMGLDWHADVCQWAAREWQRQARALIVQAASHD